MNYRYSNDDESSRMPLFEALDSLTWPRIHSSRGARTASPKSVSSTGAVIDIITSSSGSERDALTTNVDLQNSGHNPEPALTRTLSRSSAPKSLPQSPDLIMCADGSATMRKTYVPHLPQTHPTFKPIFNEQKKHHHHRYQKHRRQDVETPSLPPPISGSDPDEPEPDLPIPMESTSISRLSPMISSGMHGYRFQSPKRPSLASLYTTKKSRYHKDRSLSPLSERNRPMSPRRKASIEPVSPSDSDASSPIPAPSWSSQVDEAFKRLQLTKQTDIDVMKSSIV